MNNRKIYCAFTVALTAVGVAALAAFARLNVYKNTVTANYRRAFTELSGYVSDIDITLSKAAVTTDAARLSALADKLWLYSAFAKENLGLLPTSSVQLDNTSDFLSQVGDYTYCVTNKAERGEGLSEEEYAQLSSLSDYAKTLSAQLLKMEEGVMNGDIPVDSSEGMLAKSAPTFGSDLEEIEEKFNDYTSLIYDGPFSKHTETIRGDMLKSEEVTKESAAETAKKFTGCDTVQLTGESGGTVPTYNFTAKTNGKNREKYVKVTKNGGYVSMMLDSRQVNDVTVENTDAAKAAADFLKKNGYVKMKQTGYIIEGNCIILSYAYMQNDFVIYPDLVKVKIALDNCEVVGFEADGFLINHTESRTLPKLSLTKEQAAEKLNSKFKLSSVNKALIPLDTGKEVFCYEITGEYKDKTFLVYINTETGAEEDIQMLVKTEYGELTV